MLLLKFLPDKCYIKSQDSKQVLVEGDIVARGLYDFP